MKKHLLFIFTTIIISFLSSCITDDDVTSTGTELTIGDPVPSFSVIMHTGETFTNKDITGKVSLIIFFHTACKDCQKELPIIQRFHENYPQYTLACISRAESEKSIMSYWKENNLTLPYSAQEDRTVYELFAKQIIPRIFIIDKQGIIRYIFTDSPLAQFDELVKAVETLDK